MLQNHDDGWSDDHSTGPQLSAFPARPSTPDQSSDNESYPHGFPPTPPTDEQTRPNDNTTPAFEPPPIPLKQHTWSASHAPTRNRVSLIYPSVRKDSQASPGDLWGIAFRKLVAQYNYKRIQKDQVRLIYLKPGQLDDTICISIAVLHQDQLGTLDYPYVALSYTWGKGEADATILVQDDPKSRSVRSIKEAIDAHKAAQKVKQFKVRTNLRDALRSVRLENETVAIWIDAICVDQSHTDERNEQVSKMNYIYERAYNVNIWLGCDAEGSSCSERAMKFIPEVIKLNTLGELLKDDTHIRSWASLFELLRWSWFTRRWIIQEVALAKKANVHCGKMKCSWSDFQTAIGVFCRHFEVLKPRLKKYFEDTQPDIWPEEFDVDVGSLGAWLLVDMTATLFRNKKSGHRESTRSLEWLVCSLSVFDSTDPRDTINALRNICRELNQPNSDKARLVPVSDYKKDLFEVYRDFLRWVIFTSESLDILCRFWALKEREETSDTYSRLVDLPSYVQFAEDSAWGTAGNGLNGRQAGDSFVGMPGDHNYHASGTRGHYSRPQVQWPQLPHVVEGSDGSGDTMPGHDMSLSVGGFAIGAVTFRTDPFADGVITKPCLEGLGWRFNKQATEVPEVPNQVWQTLVANKGPKREPMPVWYNKACQNVLAKQTNNGHINIDKILRKARGRQGEVEEYLARVKAVTWNRLFIKGDTGKENDELVGFAPPGTEIGDVIAIFFGCSVPIILRPNYSISNPNHVEAYQFVGEAFIYGKMEGEALDEDFDEQVFKLI